MDGWFALFSSHDPPLKGRSVRARPLWAGHARREGRGDLNFHLDGTFDDASYHFFEEMASEGKNQ